MKRGRSSSKASVTSDTSSKEEPPKKVKKRIKQVSSSTSAPALTTNTPTPAVSTPPSTPSASVVNQPSSRTPPRETKLGSLPLYGEQLPSGGYDDIPGASKRICEQLKEVMTKVRETKKNNASSEDEKVINATGQQFEAYTHVKRIVASLPD